MAEKRQLELYLLRFLPHALRDDFVTVGLLLMESDAGFADVRFTRDWKMLQSVAPDVDLEWFELVEREIRKKLGSLFRREELIEFLDGRFGTMLDVAPIEAVENSETISLADFARSSREVFALEVRGESMQDEAILDGDFVLVEKKR